MAHDISGIAEEITKFSETLFPVGVPGTAPDSPLPEAEAPVGAGMAEDSPDSPDADARGGALLAAAGWLAGTAEAADPVSEALPGGSLSDRLTAADDRIAAASALSDLAGDALAEALADRDENGSGDLIANVAASGDQGIDGLLRGVRWSDGAITYSDPDAASDYQVGHPELFSNFQQVNADQMLAVHFALNASIYTQPSSAGGFSVEGFTGLSLTYAGSGSGAGTIRVANTSNPGTAYAYYPADGVAGGDAFFGGSGRTPDMGNYHWHTILHELGHALGLKHGHEAGSFGAMPANLDTMEYSLMTYRSYVGGPLTGYTNEQFGYAQTYMMYDIAALQYMYGADFSTNSGNTVYSWDPASGNTVINGVAAITPGGNRIFLTIWDGGGNDTYDLSAYTTNLSIDLAPGSHSVFSATQLADLDQFSADPARVARGNVFNALLYQNNTASLIENAIGGSGNDLINGNQGANRLTGGAGNDTINGRGGVDTLYGGVGNDVLDGGLFGDTSYGQDGNDTFLIQGFDQADNVYGGNGIDTLDLSGHDDTSLGFRVNLDAGTYDFSPRIFGPYVANSIEIVIGSDRLDTLLGGAVAETLMGGLGDDTIDGRGGRDLLDGGNGADLIRGGVGNDRLDGRTGNDRLVGQGGNDRLVGGVGIDTLDGGAGNDTMAGASGADTFVFANGFGIDRILDFNTAALSEIIDLRLVSAITGFGDLVANHLSTIAGNAVIDVGPHSITLVGVSVGSLSNGDFLF